MRLPFRLVFAAGLAACSLDPLSVNILVPAQQSEPRDMSAAPVGRGAGIAVSPSKGLQTTASGGAATFSVALDSRPTADVTIGLATSDVTQGTVSPSALTFGSDDWDVPQTVTVTGVDDGIVSGDHLYSIVTAPAVSSDRAYRGIDPLDVTVTNLETDAAGISLAPASGLKTTSGGGTASFTVRLTSKPSASVTIGLGSDNLQQGTVSPASVFFTPSNWSTPQKVTVTGTDNLVVESDQIYHVVTAPAASSDANYSGLDGPDVEVTNLESDLPSIVVSPSSGLVTTETGGTDSFTVRLGTQPTAAVTIGISSGNLNHGTVSPATLTFTAGPAGNWGTPHTVTITGVDDLAVTGNLLYSVITAPAVSADPFYNGLNATDVSVTSIDSSVAHITLSRTSGLVTSEGGGSDTFTIRLGTQPSANVQINLSSDTPAEGSVSPASVTFTNANWNVTQTVTVTGVQDTLTDGSKGYHVVTAPAVSTDVNYSGMDASDVSVTNSDDDINVYGGSSATAAVMTWCSPGPTDCVQPLTVNVPARGGTVNFFLALAGDSHAVGSLTNEYSSGALTTTTPFQLTLAAGTHEFYCLVHGTGMSGNLVVP